MRCERIQELPAYLDGALSERARRQWNSTYPNVRPAVGELAPCGARWDAPPTRQQSIPRDDAPGDGASCPGRLLAGRCGGRPCAGAGDVGGCRRAVSFSFQPRSLAPSGECRGSPDGLSGCAQFRASQEVGDSTGLFLLASEMVREAQ